jgi:hypothetical protein
VTEAMNTVIIKIEGPVSLESMRTKCKNNVIDIKDKNGYWKHNKLRQYFTEFLGFYIALEDPDFEFESHMNYCYDCQENAVTYRTDDELNEIIQDMVNVHPFPKEKTKSPWRVVLIPRYDRQETVILVQADHAIFDAGSALLVLLPSIIDSNDGGIIPPAFKNFTEIPTWVRVMYHLKALLIIPYGTAMQFIFGKSDNNPIHKYV